MMSNFEDYDFDIDVSYWHQKDGTYIKPKLMTDSHIENCIKQLENTKKTKAKEVWLETFREILEERKIIRDRQ